MIRAIAPERPAGVLSVCADATDVERLREQHGAGADAPLTMTVIVIAIVARVLRTPTSSDGSVDVGVALQSGDDVVAPVIRDADRKSLCELAREVCELEHAAAGGRLPRPLARASVAVTSLELPVRLPLPAVIEVGALETIAVFRGGVFEPRRVLPLRVTWGGGDLGEGEAERLCRRVAALVEDPLRLLFRGGA